MAFRSSLFYSQLKGVMYRKALMYAKSPCGFILTIISALIIALGPFIVYGFIFLMSTSEDHAGTYFSAYDLNNITFARIRNPDCDDGYCLKQLDEELKKIAKEENNIDLKIVEFDNFTQFDRWQSWYLSRDHHTLNIPCAYQVNLTDSQKEIKVLVNSTDNIYLDAAMIVSRAYYRVVKGGDSDITINVTRRSNAVTSDQFSVNAPIFGMIIYGLVAMSFVTLTAKMFMMVNQDLKSQMRQYMISCGLNRFAFWLGNFIVDFLIIFIFSTIVFIVYASVGVKAYSFRPFETIIYHYIASLTTLPFMYFLSMILPKGYISQILYSIICMFTILPFMFTAFYNLSESKKNMLMALSGLANPFISYNTLFTIIGDHLAIYINAAQPIPKNIKFFTTSSEFLAIIVPCVNIPVWSLIVLFSEFIVKRAKKFLATHEWTSYKSNFEEAHAKQNRTIEAIKMDEEINNPDNNEEYAIKIVGASKMFKDSNWKPIFAVNQVNLGIKRGCLFGFLGSNGAGKTTLMKMILRELPISHGHIYVNGVDITQIFDPTCIAICPQFDDHLTESMSGRQNMRFFCKLFNYSREESESKINEIIDILDYHEHVDKKISEMSGGNRRKCAVAVAFLSRASIVLLDEPTSSLDPIARHKVHDLINKYKGSRTFMLCTHLLDEAEGLSDMISIMMHGCIYTIGSPQHLSNKFGKEWKVDLVLQDESSETREQVDNFFRDNLPFAIPSIIRSLSRIYTIPSNAISITELFKVLLRGKQSNIGIKYYTCSCSTLEKVFMEIAMLSEKQDDTEQDNTNEHSDQNL